MEEVGSEHSRMMLDANSHYAAPRICKFFAFLWHIALHILSSTDERVMCQVKATRG